MYVINLALSDFVFSAVNGFPLMTIACIYKRWIWGETGRPETVPLFFNVGDTSDW